ncbi:MAG: mannitol-1-phosphate 5-dehydrogenase [Clostridia bacterium]|nr:mannitol-1-phosphate 5-dehydrogenase [Clostridia bacterium]MBR6719452.1 mannitol-1-phosphate 5-dehydrogenase [Clostridia bacterium]
MSCVIFGAGKIARGFIGHLLYLSGIEFTFVEKFDGLTDLMNERGQYTVNILGNEKENCVVKGAKALKFSEKEKIAEAIANADAVFNAVGGKNLGEIVPYLAAGIELKAKKGGYINFVTCENWKQPADILRNGISEIISDEAREYFENNVGITEAVIMRSAIESSKELLEKDPLIVNVQNFWELPVDASRIKGSLPEIKGLKLIESFTGFLERKFYTYNAANGTVSFLGALMGYEKIADAAHDEKILEILDGVYQETARALSIKHNFPLEEQLAFTLTSKNKLQDYTIVDFIERNARDPIRKLGKDDRLVGSARLVLSCGIKPENLSIAIAAAMYYYNETDEFAIKLKEMRENEGIDAILEKVCSLEPNGELGMMVKEKIELLKSWGYIK